MVTVAKDTTRLSPKRLRGRGRDKRNRDHVPLIDRATDSSEPKIVPPATKQKNG